MSRSRQISLPPRFHVNRNDGKVEEMCNVFNKNVFSRVLFSTQQNGGSLLLPFQMGIDDLICRCKAPGAEKAGAVATVVSCDLDQIL